MIGRRWLAFSLPPFLFGACHMFLQEESTRPSRPLEPDLLTPTPIEPEPEPESSAQPSAEEPAPVEPGITKIDTPTRGKIDPAAVEAGVQPAMRAFEACYERGLQRRPDLRGTIVVNFVVAPDGSVPYAGALEQGTDLPDDRVIHCVLEEFQKLRFAAPEGGRAVATYPLSFAPKDAGTATP